MECAILVGLPAAGKTTFYRDHLASTHDHVSKDLMRNNRVPERRQQQLIVEALEAGRSVAIDNTNPSAAVRAPLIALARAHGAQVIGYFFPAEAKDALRRNRLREERERVPDVAIFTTRKRLEPPAYEEGFDRLYVVLLKETDGTFQVHPQAG